jgi:LacI family transcriptional regulator
MRNGGRSTIHDVAKAAGVSIKTVSLVVNDKPGVGQKTRERVQKSVDCLSYRPHPAAQALRSHVARAVGVVFPAPRAAVPMSRSLQTWMYDELVRVFGSRGHYVTFDYSVWGGDENTDYSRGLWEQAFGPCVVAGPLASDDTIIERIHNAGFPYIAMSRLDRFPACSCATVDYEKAAYESARFLIKRGHRKIGLLQGLPQYQPGAERLRGYRRAMETAGLEFDESLIASVSFEESVLREATAKLLQRKTVTAVIEASGWEDSMALREGMHLADRKPGEDVDVVAWTYVSDSTIFPEACAHVWLPMWEAAKEGLHELAQWIEGLREGPIHIVRDPILRRGGSSSESFKQSRLFGE